MTPTMTLSFKQRFCRYKKDPVPAEQIDVPKAEAQPSLPEADAAVMDEFNRNLAQYGEDIAATQQETFAAALRDVRDDAQELDTEVSAQRVLQQRQQQQDYIKRNAKHISPSLHAKVRSGSAAAKPDTFSRGKESGLSISVSSEVLARFSSSIPSGNCKLYDSI